MTRPEILEYLNSKLGRPHNALTYQDVIFLTYYVNTYYCPDRAEPFTTEEVYTIVNQAIVFPKTSKLILMCFERAIDHVLSETNITSVFKDLGSGFILIRFV